jgi:6-pyruvoyltetrahydropterin/6-carboxytetrahydropterin synthase
MPQPAVVPEKFAFGSERSAVAIGRRAMRRAAGGTRNRCNAAARDLHPSSAAVPLLAQGCRTDDQAAAADYTIPNMYIINVKAHYDAAHFIREYNGKCERLHGHRYEVEIALAFESLGTGGIAFDFADAKRRLREVTEELDHQNLNDLPAFADMETSAENQARYIFETVRERLGEVGENLLYARVWETPNQWAQYSERLIV